MKRHGCKFPCMKTTRPIAITSVMVKILDRTLLEKIRPIILGSTSKCNAGFKPEMSCELQLLRIHRAIEKNMKRNLPSYIIAQDVKSGYNNVVIKDLLKKFGEASNEYYNKLFQEEGAAEGDHSQEQEGLNHLLRYIVQTPRLRIWNESPDIRINKGVLQGSISSPYLFLFVADDLTKAVEKCGSDQEDPPLVSTWADDITVVANSRVDACRVIRTQLKVSQQINLPLSAKKAQLLIIYPKNYKGEKRKAGKYLERIKILKHVKVLGLIFQ